MARYRKKPIVVEAEQWFSGKRIEGVKQYVTDDFGSIATLEGMLKVRPGDWVITGIKGEKYLCKPDIFEATYERVEE